MELSEQQFQRYARHLILDEVGEEGQEKLLASRVLVVGAGGVGSPHASLSSAAPVGEEGQEELLASRVRVVGAGGLGSPMLLYLAAAGVGTLGIIDNDRVDLTNLQRQIVHATRSVGDLKVDSARATLDAVNDGIR